MSNYKSGEWCEIWDGLFWRFIAKMSQFLKRILELHDITSFSKMEKIKKIKHLETAETFWWITNKSLIKDIE